jgi:hypothetical protein
LKSLQQMRFEARLLQSHNSLGRCVSTAPSRTVSFDSIRLSEAQRINCNPFFGSKGRSVLTFRAATAS